MELVQPRLRMRVYGLPDFEANRPGFPGAGDDGDHAGKVETSLLWALEPDGVDMDRLPADPGYPLFGMGETAGESDRGAGEKMASDVVAWLGRKQQELLDAFDPGRPSRLRTFADVENFWAEEIQPRLPDFKCMQSSWSDKAEPDSGSRWRKNWAVVPCAPA